MDILRKELNEIYTSQNLDKEILRSSVIEHCKRIASNLILFSKGCTVITDAAQDNCYLYLGDLGHLLGISSSGNTYREMDSSDEDIIYNLMHPEDLADKRMLEYEFFKYIDPLPGDDKTYYQATCRIRLKISENEYILVDNTTQVISPSPAGKIWLILCTYSLSPDREWRNDISPVIKNTRSGEIITLSFNDQRDHILTKREKEILLLIKEGKASKQIADMLEISIHTVNRHRQNIIEKLSVANSIEAITAAEAMKLL